MTDSTDQLLALIKRKQDSDQQNQLTNIRAFEIGWMSDAIELLLQLELERQQKV